MVELLGSDKNKLGKPMTCMNVWQDSSF